LFTFNCFHRSSCLHRLHLHQVYQLWHLYFSDLADLCGICKISWCQRQINSKWTLLPLHSRLCSWSASLHSIYHSAQLSHLWYLYQTSSVCWWHSHTFLLLSLIYPPVFPILTLLSTLSQHGFIQPSPNLKLNFCSLVSLNNSLKSLSLTC